MGTIHKIKVTELEKKVLEALAESMYAEVGFSDAGLDEVESITKLDTKVIRGVQSSLVKKGLINVYDREGDMGVNWRDPRTHIWYLSEEVLGLAEIWVGEEYNGRIIPQVELIVREG